MCEKDFAFTNNFSDAALNNERIVFVKAKPHKRWMAFDLIGQSLTSFAFGDMYIHSDVREKTEAYRIAKIAPETLAEGEIPKNKR